MTPLGALMIGVVLAVVGHEQFADGVCEQSLEQDLTFMLSGHQLAWPCKSTRNIYESSGRYIPKNVIPTRVQIYKDEAYVVMPRYRPGVPFTLGKMCLKTKECQAILAPYPCWSMQEEGNCEALQSAVDIFLDGNDILWVLDVGIVNTLECTPIRRCSPKVVAINVKTQRVVKVVDLSSLVTPNSRLQYLVVDYDLNGRAYLYISDAASRAILVWDITLNKGYRVVLPQAVTSGCVRRDVLYLALVRKSCGSTVLYFTYLSSYRLFSIRTEHLRRGCARGTVVDVGRKPAHLVLLGTDSGCAIFFRKKGESDIYMWNTLTCFKPENFLLVQSGGDCRLSTHVIPGYKRLMWQLESNFHDYITDCVGCLGASVSLKPLVKSCDE